MIKFKNEKEKQEYEKFQALKIAEEENKKKQEEALVEIEKVLKKYNATLRIVPDVVINGQRPGIVVAIQNAIQEDK